MHRLLLAALIVGAAFGTAQADCTPKLASPPLAQEGALIAAIDTETPPIQYIDDNGNIVGLDVDFGNAIAERLCLKMQWANIEFATMIPQLKEGRVDLIDAFMFYTPARAEQVLMVPYGASTMAILVDKKNTDPVSGPEYFTGKRIAVELGTVDYADAKAASDALEKAGKPGIDIHTFKTYADVLQALRAGQVDGGFISTEAAAYYKKLGQDFFRTALSGYDPHAEALAFSNPAIADAVLKVLNEMSADGTMTKIFSPYGHCMLPGPYSVTRGPLPAPHCPPQGS